MRRGLLFLLAPLIFSASAVAQQEVVFPDKARIAFQVTVLARNPDEVVARLLSFDRDTK